MNNNAILENDKDEEEDGILPYSGVYPYDTTNTEIEMQEDPQSVFQYVKKIERAQLITDPDFQRHVVWKPDQMSQFIESILLNFPLPPIYLNQRKDGKYLLIDGLQRTTTLNNYLNNKFALSDLKALCHLNGKKFVDLDQLLQTRIEDKKLNCYILKPSVPILVIYDLFNRINTGGTQLNRQEIRNCIYTGKSTRLLRELADSPDFRTATDGGISAKRMKDREAVLRVISFMLRDYKTEYKGELSNFLENVMVDINKMNDEQLTNLKQQFKRVMKLTFDFFGASNFRLPTFDTRGRINLAIMDSICYFFHKTDDSTLKIKKKLIIINFEKLINDPEYLKAIKGATGFKPYVDSRFSRVQAILLGETNAK